MLTEAQQTAIRTDAATIAIFDPERLQHRLSDADDWWSVPKDEIDEINKGNVLFVLTSVDGDYLVNVYQQSPLQNILPVSVRAVLSCDSGRFYCGAGEYVPAGGLQGRNPQ